MAELHPIPFAYLIRRVFRELEREQKIFDLPAAKFFQGNPDIDTSVVFHGQRAATPAGPAAGPHGQMAQNIILSWLGGGRVIELKTIQIKDQLQVPRPCIDAANVGYNVEWSQELRLEQSLREYVAASMLLEMIQASHLLGSSSNMQKIGTILDMSVGYDLAGIQSERVRRWIASMMNASAELEALRREIPDDFAHFRDLAYRTRISESITLSTFHGCPAEEIERIVHFLLTEMDVHLTVKMNPTLVGRQEVEHLLYDCLGYHDIRVVAESFDNDLKFEEALDICRRLDLTARRMGKRLVVKFSNTLVVRNHKDFFVDEVMYMSGPPLHVIAMNLVKKFRDRMGDEIPISFSAGIDQHNFATAVGLGLAPVTTCTDLLRPGGYGRLHKYMANLESRMKALGVRTLGDYVLKSEGRWDAAIRFGLQPAFRTAYENAATLDPEHFQALWAFLEKLQMELLEDIASNRADVQGHLLEGARQFESELAPRFSERLSSAIPRMLQAAYPRMVDRAGLLNTAPAVERATADPRYSAAKNSAVPKKTSSRLTLYDCINCDKCVPVCPNDGNFIYELSPVEVEVPVYEVEPTGVRQTGSTTFHIKKSHQLANYADFCNECGNCDVFCPEDGGPHLEKPRFFSSEETWRSHNNRDGFFLATGAEKDIMLGRIGRQECRLIIEHHQDRWIFEGSGMRFVFSGDAPQPVKIEPTVFSEETRLTDLRNYWIIKTLYRGILDASHVNLININADH